MVFESVVTAVVVFGFGWINWRISRLEEKGPAVFKFSLHPRAREMGGRIPTKSHASDSGWDVFPVEEFTVLPGQAAEFATGLTFVPPPGWFAEVVAKTGPAKKRLVIPAGVVFDQNYRPDPADWKGAVLSVLNVGEVPQTFGPDRSPVQLVLRPLCSATVVEVSHGTIDHKTDRGQKRYGMAEGDPDPITKD